jgi:hypothetical protein
LPESVPADTYERWLQRKAAIHARRDRKRGFPAATCGAYKERIHAAVLASEGKDDYTGEPLAWHLIGTYDNAESKEGRHHYKFGFALLPTVDHCDVTESTMRFKICGWRTNDAKHDLPLGEFLDLCRKVLEHAGHRVILRS